MQQIIKYKYSSGNILADMVSNNFIVYLTKKAVMTWQNFNYAAKQKETFVPPTVCSAVRSALSVGTGDARPASSHKGQTKCGIA